MEGHLDSERLMISTGSRISTIPELDDFELPDPDDEELDPERGLD